MLKTPCIRIVKNSRFRYFLILNGYWCVLRQIIYLEHISCNFKLINCYFDFTSSLFSLSLFTLTSVKRNSSQFVKAFYAVKWLSFIFFSTETKANCLFLASSELSIRIHFIKLNLFLKHYIFQLLILNNFLFNFISVYFRAAACLILIR